MMSQCSDDSDNGQAVITPHANDILSGRGNFVNYHPGNEQFRAMVRKHKVAYVACPKSMKGSFAEMIVEEIKRLNPPGRFLKQDDTTKLWYDIGEKKAFDKTRQALREGAPEIQKEISGDDIVTPVTTKKEMDRSVVDGDIDVVPSGHPLLQERRTSEFVTTPTYAFVDDTSNFAQLTNTESYHPGSMMLQQQQSTPMQMNMMPQVMHRDDSDPYCSSLPPEHYESYKTHGMMNHNHTMNSYNPSLTMESNNNVYTMYNKEFNFVPTFGNPTASLMTINEPDRLLHNAGAGYYSQNQLYTAPSSQYIGMSNQNEYTMPQLNITSDQIKSHSNGNQPMQPNSMLAAGQRLQNQTIKDQNRTYNVRPQPIKLGSTDQNNTVGAPASKSFGYAPEKSSSLSSKDVAPAPTKSCLRSVTPRRMIINIQHPNSRSVTPRKMDTTTPEITPVRYNSPPRNSRSRLRARRDDSARSMASTNSISFDKIFSEFADDGCPSYKSSPSYKSKNTNSGASFLSVMSLSVGDIMLTVDEKDSDSQGSSTEKVSMAQSIATMSTPTISTTSTTSMRRVPPKRNGSSDIMNLEKGVLEMSVNTISIDDSDVASSQGDMSFLNVFE